MRFKNILILFLVILFSGLIDNINAQSKAQQNTQKFATMMYLIDNFYVDTINSEKVVEDAIIAALKELEFLVNTIRNNHPITDTELIEAHGRIADPIYLYSNLLETL